MNGKYGEEFKGWTIKLAEKIGVKTPSEKLGIAEKTKEYAMVWLQARRPPL